MQSEPPTGSGDRRPAARVGLGDPDGGGGGPAGAHEEFSVRTCRAVSGCPRAVAEVAWARDACEEALVAVDAAALLRARVEGVFREHHRFKVVISGCPNQCSQPQVADVGLVGQRVPAVDHDSCIACGLCVEACDEGALSLVDGRLEFDRRLCEGCGSCIAVCPTGSMTVGEQGWRVLVGGRLGRHPRLAARVAACAGSNEALGLLTAVVRAYDTHAEGEERVGAALDRAAGVAAAWPDEQAQEWERARALAALLAPTSEDRPRVDDPGVGGPR